MRRLTCTLALVVGLLGVGFGAPAHAANELALSSDGRTWTTGSLTRPLFDPEVRWVPGDVRTARFFIRNEALAAGLAGVSLIRNGAEPLYDSGSLRIEARAGDGEWQDVRRNPRLTLARDVEVPAGDVVRVQVRIGMRDAAPNVTMDLGSDFDLAVTLEQDLATGDGTGGSIGEPDPDGSGGAGGAGAGAGGNVHVLGPGSSTDSASAGLDSDDAVPGDGGTSVAGLLPATGSPVSAWMLALTVLLLGAGSYLMTLRRRTDDAEPDVGPTPEVAP